MASISPLTRTLGESVFLQRPSADDVTILADTAKFLHLLDNWFADEDLVYLTVGTVTVSMPVADAESFVRGLLQRYDDCVRQKVSAQRFD